MWCRVSSRLKARVRSIRFACAALSKSNDALEIVQYVLSSCPSTTGTRSTSTRSDDDGNATTTSINSPFQLAERPCPCTTESKSQFKITIYSGMKSYAYDSIPSPFMTIWRHRRHHNLHPVSRI
jgi:hypothetical protein